MSQSNGCAIGLESRQEDAPRLDEKLKDLIKELGTAINDALSESRPITDAIQNVRDAGYDVLPTVIGMAEMPHGRGCFFCASAVPAQSREAATPRRMSRGCCMGEPR